MKPLFLFIVFGLLAVSHVGYAAKETAEAGKEPVQMNLIIPSPVEMIVWGKTLNIKIEIPVSMQMLEYAYADTHPHYSAVYLGRTLAILLLAMDRMDQKTLGKFFLKIREGMTVLKMDPRYIEEFEGLRIKFENRRISRAQLINRMDIAYAQLIAASDPKKQQDRLYRILQGSAWVQGQNLLAKSIKQEKKYEFAKLLLDRPAVTQFIIAQLKEAQQEEKSAKDLDALIQSMETYQKVTSAPEMDAQEVEIIIKETDKFLLDYQLKGAN